MKYVTINLSPSKGTEKREEINDAISKVSKYYQQLLKEDYENGEIFAEEMKSKKGEEYIKNNVGGYIRSWIGRAEVGSYTFSMEEVVNLDDLICFLKNQTKEKLIAKKYDLEK